MNKLKVIIADDNKILAEIEKKFLEKNSSIDILGIATSSEDEMKMIEQHSPDIIITDIDRKNEKISGLDIILKCEKENKKIKFILITATNIQNIIIRNELRLPQNIVGYMQKPMIWNDFNKLVEMVVNNTEYDYRIIKDTKKEF